jgi:hypothetical protein
MLRTRLRFSFGSSQPKPQVGQKKRIPDGQEGVQRAGARAKQMVASPRIGALPTRKRGVWSSQPCGRWAWFGWILGAAAAESGSAFTVFDIWAMPEDGPPVGLE